MSDSFISIIPDGVKEAEAKELADKVVDKLVQRGIIKIELTNCTLGNSGHKPGDNYNEAIKGEDFGFRDLVTNGLEIITDRQVFDNGGNGLDEITCPDCNADIIDTDWVGALEEWVNNTGQDRVTCPQCGAKHSISKYNFVPAWGFGNLGFKFWNWPDLTDDFIRNIEQLLRREVTIVYGRL